MINKIEDFEGKLTKMKLKKRRTPNERFCESGGVCPLELLC